MKLKAFAVWLDMIPPSLFEFAIVWRCVTSRQEFNFSKREARDSVVRITFWIQWLIVTNSGAPRIPTKNGNILYNNGPTDQEC